MEGFDLQSVWTAAGMSAAALVIGYIFGFLQSVAPFLPSSGNVRNWTLAAIAAGIVILAALGTGKTLDSPNALADVFGGFLVFVGIYNAAKNAHGAGEATAVSTAHGSSIGPADTPI